MTTLNHLRAQGWQPQRETAIGTFVLWLEAWEAKYWGDMADLCQLTVRLTSGGVGQVGDLGVWLKGVYGVRTLLDAEIEGINEISPMCADIKAKLISLDGESGQRTSFITARVVRESGLRQPSETGEWGVNPLSAMRGLFR